MCWFAFTKEEKQVMKAEKDIDCYKIVNKGEDGSIESYIKGFRYELGKEYSCGPLKFDSVNFLSRISKGFHSYSGDCVASFNPSGVYEGVLYTHGTFILDGTKDCLGQSVVLSAITDEAVESYIVKCRIPSGSTYYVNRRGEIVSDRLVFGDKLISISHSINKGPVTSKLSKLAI